jgi:hypothetical protein
MPTLVLTKNDLKGAGILSTIEIPGSGSGGGGTDADVTAFLTAASISDNTIETSLNTFVTTLKNESLWDEILACYPFVTDKTDAIDIQSQFKFNLKDPQDTDAAYRLTTNGSVTYNTTGIVTGQGLNSLSTHLNGFVPTGTGLWHNGSNIQGFWDGLGSQVYNTSQPGVNDKGTFIYGRLDDNTWIYRTPASYKVGVSDAQYGGDFVNANIASANPGQSRYYGVHYHRTNTDTQWQVLYGDSDGVRIARWTFNLAYNDNEVSHFMFINAISEAQTLTLQNAVNQLQTDLGRATH